MDIRGIWKIKEIRMPTPEGLTVITPDNLPEDERFEECVQRMRCYTEFADDGSLNTLILVPEELKAEAAEHGVVVREDGYAVIESTTWKEENGKFYYDTRRPSMELLCAKMAMLLLRAQLGKKKTENSTTTPRLRVNFWEKK